MAWRRRHGLSQRQAADIAGVSRRRWRAVEDGTRVLDGEQQQRLHDTLATLGGLPLGPWLRRQRRARGYRQEDLAQLLHVDARTITRWEHGQGIPQVRLRGRLIRALGLDPHELLDRVRAARRVRTLPSQNPTLFGDDPPPRTPHHP